MNNLRLRPQYQGIMIQSPLTREMINTNFIPEKHYHFYWINGFAWLFDDLGDFEPPY
jgi:hypothetical protein